jgi:2-oxoglutarate dehydrogenase E2 component (dihydrolipoamide succinyltransferase)
LTKWLKKVGDTVQRDEPLFEISTDKVDAEIPSPASGTLQEIRTEAGATVQINTVVAVIGDGAGASGASQNGGGQAQAKPAAAAAAPAAKPATPQETADKPAADSSTPAAIDSAATNEIAGGETVAPPAPFIGDTAGGTDVLMPQMGESITEGTITKWLKQVGEKVERDEPLFEISTDKVDAEIPSPVAGTLTAIKAEAGQTVAINTVVAVIDGAAGAKPAAAPPAAAPASAAAPAPAAAAPAPAASASAGERLRSSPLVRKIAKENNVDLTQVPGTGSEGRITKTDILGFLENGPPARPAAQAQVSGAKPGAPASAVPPVATAVAAAKAPATLPAEVPLSGELVPMSKMRSIIAKRMVESKHTSPHVHTVFKVDMTRIVRLREKEKSKYEQRNGVKLTYMPFITRAAVVALRKHPIVNAFIEGDAIRYNKNINIGIAVALEWGLIVPVIKQAEEKNFLGIARSIVDVADRARGKKLAPDEISGGTFTLTNSGIFGEQFGTPIINQPQAAILGIGGLNKEPEVITDKDGNDSIAIRSIQRFTLGFDHRIVDGADAGKFMSDFKAYLENWNEDIG